MRILTSVLAVSMLVLVGSARAQQCPGPNDIVDPPEFVWTNNVGTIEIAETYFPNIGGDDLNTRAYGQNGNFSIPGPTIRMTRGQTYILSFKNSLDWEVPSPVHNELKDPNITNIHTHGLHVSGETPADDVTRLINGQQCGDYMYEVQGDHMPGTLWYHAHHHGSTSLQVAGGAFGLLLIEDDQNYPYTIPAGVAGMEERLLAIGFLDTSVAGDGNDNLMSGSLPPTWTVNGKVGGSLCMPANEWQNFRVLLADRDARLKTLSVGDQCEVALMARDGVWRTEVPKELPTNSIELTGASRADLAVRCTSDSTISVGGTVVANVVVGASGNTGVGPYDGADPTGDTGKVYWEPSRPDYLRDLRGAPGTINAESINMGARTVNGSKFDAAVSTFDISADAIQEWNIKGARNHPFHLHVYHVQMQSTCGAFEEGEYYDTLAANCLTRFDTNETTSTVYDGRTIMHCHILEHEDLGAMGWVDVQGGIPAPTLPGDKKALYHCAPCPNPDAPPVEDICDDGADDDCDGLIDAADPDCGAACIPTEDPEVTTCFDGFDNDCDTLTDCADGSCDGAINGTCDTGDPGICAPGTYQCQGGAQQCVADTGPGTEGPSGDPNCSDSLDNDCDGLTDGNDPDCGGGGCVPTHSKEKGPRCSDGIDNDCDTLIDGADPDC
jgi:FtsP/CotA-like multicopper oxidase with cupredoxin domain